MNAADADFLAERIAQTWRGGPSTAAWADVLSELDHARAEQAFRRLRTESEHTPSIARFMVAYRSLGTDRLEPNESRCTTCDGTGMVTEWWECHGLPYPLVGPCPAPSCPHVAGARPVLYEARRFNDAQRDTAGDRNWRRLTGPPDPTVVQLPLAPEEQW